MKSIDLQTLLKQLQRFGLKGHLNKDPHSLKFGSIELRAPRGPADFDRTNQSGDGFLLTNSTSDIRQSLEQKGISYVDDKGYVFLRLENLELKIMPKTKKKLETKKRADDPGQTELSPSNLVNPNSFALLDVLFRLEDREVASFKSTLGFCNEFKLHQPSVSKLLSKVGKRSVLDFKNAIRKIPFEWWLYSMDSSATKRKMIPFFSIADDYTCLNLNIAQASTKEFAEMEKEGMALGPSEIPKLTGALSDQTRTIWMSAERSAELKREFKLVPGRQESARTWQIAIVPNKTLNDIVSHVPYLRFKHPLNQMRVIWDLGFGDSRMREVRTDLLREFLK